MVIDSVHTIRYSLKLMQKPSDTDRHSKQIKKTAKQQQHVTVISGTTSFAIRTLCSKEPLSILLKAIISMQTSGTNTVQTEYTTNFHLLRDL